MSLDEPNIQPPSHNQAPQTFLWVPMAALFALVQSADSTSSPIYHIAPVHPLAYIDYFGS